MSEIQITQAYREAWALKIEKLGDKEYADLIRDGKLDTYIGALRSEKRKISKGWSE